MVDQRITDYVKSCMDAGVPLNRIRSDLYKAGWQKGDIEEALVSAGRPGKPVPGADAARLQAGPKSRRLMFRGVIAVILLGIGIFTYFIVLSLLSPSNPPVIPYSTTCGDGKCEGTETYENCLADCPAPATNQDVSLGINPESSIVSAGQTVSFDVKISSVSNLYGFQFDMEFDPNQLSFSSAAEGTFLNKNGAEQTFCIPPKASAGTPSRITIACTRLGQTGGVSGSGKLSSVTFTAAGSGTAEPKLKNIKLVDYSLNTISLTP